MDERLHDLLSDARWLIVATWVAVALFAAKSVASLAGLLDSVGTYPPSLSTSGVALIVRSAYIIVAVLGLRWIYRAASNACILSRGETRSPFWAVCWYFVPILNLVKPYRGIREVWQATVHPADWRNVDPSYLPALWRWWILWRILSMMSEDVPLSAVYHHIFAILVVLVSLPLAGHFTRLVRDVSWMQWHYQFAEVFA